MKNFNDCLFNFDFSLYCSKLIFAKFLGYFIFFLSFTLKFPQIFTIIKNKSTKGLSESSNYLDFLNVLFQGFYCIHLNLPFTLYSEYFNSAFQNFLIILLSWKYRNNLHRTSKSDISIRGLFIISTILFTYTCCLDQGKYIPSYIWDLIGASNIPLIAFSRFSQIYSIIKTKDTQSVSEMSYFMRFMKNALKSISIFLESSNLILLINQIYNGTLSLIVALLIIYYRKLGKQNKINKISENKEEKKHN